MRLILRSLKRPAMRCNFRPFVQVQHWMAAFVLAATLGGHLPAAEAHEYYLEPETFAPKAGADVKVSHKLGQRFYGNEMPWVTRWNVRSEIWHKGTSQPVNGEIGDRPALTLKNIKPGLTIGVHQSNVDFITFKTWEKFRTYVFKEGIGEAARDSEEGRKPKIGLKEGYSRYAKTLIYAGTETDYADQLDRATGLKIELIALDNPMTLDPAKPLRIQALYDGKPYVGGMIKLFTGIKTEASHRILTDKNGQARIPSAGPGPYLLNIIKMTQPQSQDALDKEAHWESFWATLTFQRRG
ncbi:MAG: DUF4198 domain-containing protein [Pseudomonadota bacterium]